MRDDGPVEHAEGVVAHLTVDTLGVLGWVAQLEAVQGGGEDAGPGAEAGIDEAIGGEGVGEPGVEPGASQAMRRTNALPPRTQRKSGAPIACASRSGVSERRSSSSAWRPSSARAAI